MCGCGGSVNGKPAPVWTVTLPGGRKKTYSRQDTAANEALRTGGFVTPPVEVAVSS